MGLGCNWGLLGMCLEGRREGKARVDKERISGAKGDGTQAAMPTRKPYFMAVKDNGNVEGKQQGCPRPSVHDVCQPAAFGGGHEAVAVAVAVAVAPVIPFTTLLFPCAEPHNSTYQHRTGSSGACSLAQESAAGAAC